MISLDRVIADTRSLIAIDSTNPGTLEAACAAWCEQRLTALGLTVTRHPVEPGRDNLATVIAGSDPSAPRLVFVAHMDTVPIGEGWSKPALGGVIEDGRLYGRGACDMKAGLAVSIGLLEALMRTGTTPRGDVVLFLTVDEEAPGMLGAHQLVADGLVRVADQIIAPEPSGMRLRIAQMGLRWLTLTVRGRMAHAGRAHLGVNANHLMARMIERLSIAVDALPFEDDILGRPRFTCGTISGGVAPNVVSPSAEAQLDLRIVPPLLPEDAIAIVRNVASSVVDGVEGASFEIGMLGASRPPVRASDDSKIVRDLRAAYRTVSGAEPEIGGADGHEAYTDSAMIAALLGLDSSTVLGPGATDQAHTADEFVPIADLELASRVFWELTARW